MDTEQTQKINKQKFNDALQRRIDTGNKLKKNLSNSEFLLFLDIVKNKQRQYKHICLIPNKIGRIVKNYIGNNDSYYRVSIEEDDAILREARIRYHTFEQILSLIDDLFVIVK